MSICIFNNNLKYKLLYESENYLNDLYNTKNIYFTQPIYFYNGLNHNDSCLYTHKNIKNVLNYLHERFKMNIKNLLWNQLNNNVYINELTNIVKFINLNDNNSCKILLDMLKDKKIYLSENNLIMTELLKDYNEL